MMAGIKLKQILNCLNETISVFEEGYFSDCPVGADCSEQCKYYCPNESGWTCDNPKRRWQSFDFPSYTGRAEDVPMKFADMIVQSISIGTKKGYRGKKENTIKLTVRKK